MIKFKHQFPKSNTGAGEKSTVLTSTTPQATSTIPCVQPGQTSTMKIREQMLTCQLCSRKFRLRGRRPMALSCMHTFCEECLTNLLAQSQDNKKQKNHQVNCPLCYKATDLGKNKSVNSLSVNPSIIELLTILEKQPSLESNDDDLPSSKIHVVNVSSLPDQGRSNGIANGYGGGYQGGNPRNQKSDPIIESSSFISLTSLVSTVSVVSRDDPSASKQQALASGQPPSSLPEVMCNRCGKKPASVTVACAAQMSVQQLCAACLKQAQRESDARDTNAVELQSKGSGASQLPDPVGKIAPASCDSSKNSVTLARYGSSADKQRSYDSQIITSGAEKAVIAVGKSATSAINTNRPGSYHERLNKTKDAAIGSDDTPSCGCIGTSTDEPVAEFEHPRQNFKTKIGSKEPSGVKRMEDHAQQTTLRSEIRRVRPGVQSQGSQSTLRSPADQTRSSVAGEAIQTAPLDVFAAYGTAPAIEEIYPPASNPPFNPDFNQTGQVPIWSSTVQVGEGCAVPSRPPPSQPAVPCASYNPEKAPVPLESFVNGGVPPVAAAVNRRAPLSGERVALSFVLPTNAGQPQLAAPLEPPKYEEIMQNAGPQFPAGFHPASGYGYPDYGYPYPPGAQCGQPAPVRLIRAFGRYGEISTQPGTFRAPGRISVTGSGAGEKSPEGAVKIVVTDRQNGTVQVFTEFGECLSILRVDGVNGACMWTDNRRLTVGTDRGLEVYDINGTRQECIPIGPVINVVPYQTGFIAVQSRSLSVFKGPSPVLTRTIAGKNKPGQYNRLEPFDELVDIAISNQQDLVVLESSPSRGATITVMTEDGYVRSTIIPAQTESCGPLVQPCAIAVDSSLNIIVADSGSGTVTACGTGTPARVLLFGFSGRLQRVLFGAGAPSGSLQTPADDASRGPWPASLDVGPEDRLYVVMRGDKVAEIRVFTYS